MGIAEQRIKRNRLVVARSDHPPDQIPPRRTIGRRHGFGRQTRGIKVNGLAVGGENNFLPDRSGDVEIGFFADKATGCVRLSRAANPVEPDLYRLVLGAGLSLWADDADLEFGYRGRPALRQAHGPLDELGEDDHAARLLGVAQRRSRGCANAGVASASAGTSNAASCAPFVLNFMWGLPFNTRHWAIPRCK